MKKHIVHISLPGTEITGLLLMPESPSGLVIFSVPGGSFQADGQRMLTARLIADRNYAMLICNLLEGGEDKIFENRYNIPLLTKRLLAITRWTRKNKKTAHLAIALFSIGTGAAAAIRVAAVSDPNIKCIVSMSGRPDLGGESLSEVESPVLLVTDGLHSGLIESNQRAMHLIRTEVELQIIPGIIQESRKYEKLAHAALEWFGRHLAVKKKIIFGQHSATKIRI